MVRRATESWGFGQDVSGEIGESNLETRLKGILRKLREHRAGPAPAAKGKQHLWAIGMYEGDSLADFAPAAGPKNPVLTHRHITDVPALFVADPFMVHSGDAWFMFFEVMNGRDRKGEIGLATSGDGRKWKYRKIVLAERFHLSYPYVFQRLHDHYMLPECHVAGALRLYKAEKFPEKWIYVGELMKGPYYADSSLARFQERWWLFTDTSSPYSNDTLRLYFADELLGNWAEHPQSPIIRGDAHIARPAGRVVVAGDRLVRYAQDCSPVYGTRVRAFEIIELSPSIYREREMKSAPVLEPSGTGWNRCGMHHIDPHPRPNGRWLACVDGWEEAEY